MNKTLGVEELSEVGFRIDLFWPGFVLLVLKFLLESIPIIGVPNAFLTVLLGLGCAFLALKVLAVCNKYSRPSFVLTALFCATLAYVLSGETVLLTTLLVIFASVEVSSQDVIRLWCWMIFPVLTLMLILFLIELFPGIDLASGTFNAIGGFRAVRSSLWFGHPNTCAGYFVALALAYATRIDVSRLFKVTVFAISFFVVFFITGSRTSTMSMLAFLLFYLFSLYGNARSAQKYSFRFVWMTPIIIAVITLFISSYWFSEMYSWQFDNLLSGRPSLWWAQWSQVGLTFFGQHSFVGPLVIKSLAMNIVTVDGAYASLLFNLGLAGAFCFLLLFKHWASDTLIARSNTSAAALAAVAVAGFTEWAALNCCVFVVLLLLGDSLHFKERGQ